MRCVLEELHGRNYNVTLRNGSVYCEPNDTGHCDNYHLTEHVPRLCYSLKPCYICHRIIVEMTYDARHYREQVAQPFVLSHVLHKRGL